MPYEHESASIKSSGRAIPSGKTLGWLELEVSQLKYIYLDPDLHTNVQVSWFSWADVQTSLCKKMLEDWKEEPPLWLPLLLQDSKDLRINTREWSPRSSQGGLGAQIDILSEIEKDDFEAHNLLSRIFTQNPKP